MTPRLGARTVKLTFLKGVVLGSVVAVITMIATSAVASTGIGGVFNLGKTNNVNATSGLKGTASGPMLAVKNKGSGTALSLTAGKGTPPFKVSSTTQVAKLNASLLGGLASASFVKGGGEAHAFAVTMAAGQMDESLLSIPGYGSLQARCTASFGTVIYRNGPHAVDLWHFAATEPNPHAFGTGQASVPAAADQFVLGVPPGNTAWLRMIIDNVTRSGIFFIRRVAIVDVGLHFDGSTCKFVAEELAGAGRVLP
jgi:hypothetical protein